ARRPLASSRATSYAALIPAPKNNEEWNKTKNFIVELSKWENSLNPNIIKKAREDILKANNGKPPKVLDPFAGGGSIPLECLRLGCETYASDYNPVATLILKWTLEYPQKYGKTKEGKKTGLLGKEVVNPLLEDIKKWGNWVLEEARKEIGKFYLSDDYGSIPIGYIWARTIPCQNPSCNAEIPLMKQFWLAKKTNKKIALCPFVKNNKVEFEIVGQSKPFPDGFNPEIGTVSRAIAKCLVCGSTIDAKTTRKLFSNGKSNQRMVAVVLHEKGRTDKSYRLANKMDIEIFKEAEKYLEKKREKLMKEWGIEPVPDEEMDVNDPTTVAGRGYGITKWGDLFNSRQKLALITFVEKVREAYKKILKENYEEEYAKAVMSYLGLMLGKLIANFNILCTWHCTSETNLYVFREQGLPMTWDYHELNPIGNWQSFSRILTRVINNISYTEKFANIFQSSATSLPYPDNFFDAVFTDPPYYNNINYSVLSDFFYVWLKRTIGDLYQDLFSTPLTPKSKEIIADPNRQGSQEKAKEFFEKNLKKSFQEISRVLKPEGISIIVYTHKSTSGWETIINSLLDSGLIVTASWPINTEMQTRPNARESAALASSIYIVCRKIQRQNIGWFNEVKEEIKNYLKVKLERLWNEGISGPDFFISGIGSAIEVFGKYEKVLDFEGNIVRADRLLEFVRQEVTNFAVKQILHNGFGEEISPLTRFYVLWRWTYGEGRVIFDDARKLSQSVGIDLEKFWNKSFILKEKEFIKVLGPQERNFSDLKDLNELIDVLHLVLILWEKGEREAMINFLQNTGWGNKDSFYRVAQAISETLPIESKEKKLLDGFLSGKTRLIEGIKTIKSVTQQRLF
ncbi:MAG: DUF1156 domain-containing protein, partial [Candidatus Ratteibacteria bacterium]